MARDSQRRKNVSDEATLETFSLNNTTSTTIKTAGSNFIFWSISNDSNRDIWLKMQAASVDNIKTGILVPSGGYWEMPMDNFYIGEISAISNTGSPEVETTLY